MTVPADPLPAALLDAYLATVVADTTGSVWSGPGALATLPYSPVVVITAWNPFSRQCDRDVNRAANASLRRRIAAEAPEAVVIDAFGRSIDGTWSEDCFIVSALPVGVADRLAVEFGQHAVFELTPHSHVVRAAGGYELARRSRFLED